MREKKALNRWMLVRGLFSLTDLGQYYMEKGIKKAKSGGHSKCLLSDLNIWLEFLELLDRENGIPT